ncbi:MAG: hypothetical protein ACKVQQ_23550 [Burkholderiales bacterium]
MNVDTARAETRKEVHHPDPTANRCSPARFSRRAPTRNSTTLAEEKMSTSQYLATLIASAILATAAHASEEKKPASAPAAASASAPSADKPKAKRHNHAAERGVATSSEPAESKPPKKPLHNHAKEHKHQ